MSGEPDSSGPKAGSMAGHGRQRTMVSEASQPFLPRYIKLRHDATRDMWIVQAPERNFYPDAIAVAVLKLCDGKRTVGDLAEALSLSYNASKEQIQADIIPMLQELADKGVVSCTAPDLH